VLPTAVEHCHLSSLSRSGQAYAASLRR
jgi:hypothetical protein